MYGNKMGMKCMDMGMGNERETFCSTYVDMHERIHTGQKPVNLMEMSGIFICVSVIQRPTRLHTGLKS